MIFKAINLDKIIKGPLFRFMKRNLNVRLKKKKASKKGERYVSVEDEFKMHSINEMKAK